LGDENRGSRKESKMREYKSVRTKAPLLSEVANEQAKDDWHVLTVLPAQYLSVTGTSGLEIIEIVILFQRDA
jgi:hypothetical protein